jgi:phosphatidylglycerol---prolipoprotein diacylglyceryl transferase
LVDQERLGFGAGIALRWFRGEPAGNLDAALIQCPAQQFDDARACWAAAQFLHNAGNGFSQRSAIYNCALIWDDGAEAHFVTSSVTGGFSKADRWLPFPQCARRLGLRSFQRGITLLSLLAAAGAATLQWTDLGLTRGIMIGSFMLRWYSLAYLGGIVFAYWHTTRQIKTAGAPLGQAHADDLFFYCTLGIVLGGRLGYATFYEHALWAHPAELLKLWNGGMSFHGGLLGVLVAITWVVRKHQLTFLRVCDYIAVAVPMGMLLGRLANFVNGELWGKVAGEGVPWVMVFPDGGPLPRHPSQLYEALLEGAVLLVVMLLLFWKTRARFRPGLLVGIFAAGIGVARFIVEFYRQPDAQLSEFALRSGMSMGQWLTLPLIAVGLIFAFRALKKPELGSGIPADT